MNFYIYFINNFLLHKKSCGGLNKIEKKKPNKNSKKKKTKKKGKKPN